MKQDKLCHYSIALGLYLCYVQHIIWAVERFKWYWLSLLVRPSVVVCFLFEMTNGVRKKYSHSKQRVSDSQAVLFASKAVVSCHFTDTSHALVKNSQLGRIIWEAGVFLERWISLQSLCSGVRKLNATVADYQVKWQDSFPLLMQSKETYNHNFYHS